MSKIVIIIGPLMVNAMWSSQVLLKATRFLLATIFHPFELKKEQTLIKIEFNA